MACMKDCDVVCVRDCDAGCERKSGAWLNATASSWQKESEKHMEIDAVPSHDRAMGEQTSPEALHLCG